MVLRRVIRDVLLFVLVSCAMLVGFGFINEAVSGRYAVDTEEFVAVVKYGDELNLKGCSS